MYIVNRPFVNHAQKLNIFLLATITSLMLLFLMQQLVSTTQPELKITTPTKIKGFIYIDKTTPVQFDTKNERPKETIQPPVTPIEVVPDQVKINDIDGTKYVLPTVKDIKQDSISPSTPLRSNFIPIDYPSIALKRNLCGWVIVQYDIKTSGGVSNVVIVDSSNSVFEKSARKSVSKYKYKPPMSNGKPIEVVGLQTKVSYELETGCN